MKKPERLHYERKVNVGFPEGTLDEVIKHVTDVHTEAVADCHLYERDGCVISSIIFREEWYGYEDCEYTLVLAYEEPLELFNARLNEWEVWNENKKRKDAEIKANQSSAARIKKIKELEAELAKLKGSK